MVDNQERFQHHFWYEDEQNEGMISDFEGDFSSIIACSLVSKDVSSVEEDEGKCGFPCGCLVSTESPNSSKVVSIGEYTVKILYAREFENLRRQIYSSEFAYIRSLGRGK